MKKSLASISLMVVIILSLATTVFAAFSYSSPNYNLAGGTVKFGNGVIVNTGKYRDDLKINLYRGTTLVATKTITLNPGQWIYPGTGTTPELILATGLPAGQYRYELSAWGSWHVMAGIYQ
ncbi:hypothetical protein I6N90_13745 [Paenibacillus sp. GSMTC-2017]|uniref:hypothetical protein n=1 Tax=Paenibacillus sp. GSMTC-2017 TaxID=2794350 RepID=UPI0018D6AC41|nr:hypothetical protein [Paenibacillus sp. GSMTC-2017]MBH5318863.1 hypothetical protein [Paenibacillus sp. GSMTC-2017]